ncbi:MAG: hypothetical protein ABIM64_04710 [candidate division WOR-3 bacterium]
MALGKERKERVKGKRQICLFVDPFMFKKFKKLCVDEEISCSRKIEQLMTEFVKESEEISDVRKEEVAKK